MQTERHLEESAGRNPYQLALLRMHQAHYHAQPHKQSALLQVLLCEVLLHAFVISESA